MTILRLSRSFLVLLMTSSVLVAQVPNVKTISEVFPMATKQWETAVQGEVMDIEVPRADDHVYYVTEESKKFRLYKSKLDGSLVWVREWKKEKPYYYVYGLKTSDKGNLVTIHTVDGSEENVRTRVYDGDGNNTYYDTVGGHRMGFYYPSPSGNYLSFEATNNFYPLEIFDARGKPVQIGDISFLKGGRLKHRFVAHDRLLVYEEYEGKGYLYLITVPEGNELWTYDFDSPIWLMDFNERNCSFTKTHIAVQGTRRPSDLYLFDYAGDLVWKAGGFYSNHAISFSSDEKKIIAVDKGDTIVIVEVSSGETLGRFRVEQGGMIGRPQFDMVNNQLFITQSIAFGNESKNLGVSKYFSHIIELTPEGIQTEDIVIRGILGTKYDREQSELTIISSQKDEGVIAGRVKYVEK